VTAYVQIVAGHDVRYFTSGQGHGGCSGAMSYYTASGEPPGQWAGKGAATLGLSGVIDAKVMENLYGQHIGPDGQRLTRPRGSKDDDGREDAAVAAHLAEHPFASGTELAEVRIRARGTLVQEGIPYWDLTVSAAKSVSVLHASLRIAAMQARNRGELAVAAPLDAEADAIETDLIESARFALDLAEQTACYTRAGHHDGHGGGEYLDARGFTAGLFLHHLSREGDPQIHVHVPILNLVQRDDGADDKWRTLDSRAVIRQKPALRAAADREFERRLIARGYAMAARPDGYGAEIVGVPQAVIDEFSSRKVAVSAESERLIGEWKAAHDGEEPNQRTRWLLHQQAGQNTRKTKADARKTLAGKTGAAEPTEAERMASWDRQTAAAEMQVLSSVHGTVRAHSAVRGDPVALDDTARAKAARIAVAEVQKHHAAWSLAQLKFEVGRALPVGATPQDVSQVARLAVSGRADAGVLQVAPSPEVVTGVESLAVRKDGASILRPPDETRYTTQGHLDLEEHILKEAQREVTPWVNAEAAWSAVSRTGLSREQREAVVRLLTTGRAVTVLNAAAGSGKTRTLATFAQAWAQLTGRRVIGITTSQNAAEVLAGEAAQAGVLMETHNSAAFLGKIEGSDELRHPVPVHEGDVLVLDEASQLSTADLAELQQSARHAGALLVPAGDVQQLGPVEAGGMLRLLATELGSIELTEVRRFDAGWEADASLRIRGGDLSALAAYDVHGRIRGADREAAYDSAARAYLADHLQGKDTLLLAGSNAEAAELAQIVQARLIRAGRVQTPRVALADGSRAGAGDHIRARLNTHIDAGGRRLTNRDVLRVTAIRGPHVEVRRLLEDRSWSAPFFVPDRYLKTNAELNYAGNIHVAQGRTVDTSHLLVTPTVDRRGYYVGTTRGREANTSWVVTGETSHGKEPFKQADPAAVIAEVLQRDSDELTATEQIREAQEWSSSSGHVLNIWKHAAGETLHLDIDRLMAERLTEHEYWRYQREHQRPVLHKALQERQLAGQDIHAVIDRITAGDLTGAKSVSAVLHGRLQDVQAPEPVSGTWQSRTPANAPQLAREAARALDNRAEELGQRLLEKPEPWLTDRLGAPPAPDASPLLREDYARRAGTAASYREAAGITGPEVAIRLEGHRGNPELEAMRQDTIHALEIEDDQALIRAATRGELESDVLQGQRAQATAPPDVSTRLKLTAQAQADARAQAADAEVRQEAQEAAGVQALAETMAAERAQLEAQHADYQRWSESTAQTRETAGQAQAELTRRGDPAVFGPAIPDPDPEPDVTDLAEWLAWFDRQAEAAERSLEQQAKAKAAETTPQQTAQRHAGAGGGPGGGDGKPVPQREAEEQPEASWWEEFDRQATAMEKAIEQEHQAAVDEGRPWPPQPRQEPDAARETAPVAVLERDESERTASEVAPETVHDEPAPVPGKPVAVAERSEPAPVAAELDADEMQPEPVADELEDEPDPVAAELDAGQGEPEVDAGPVADDPARAVDGPDVDEPEPVAAETEPAPDAAGPEPSPDPPGLAEPELSDPEPEAASVLETGDPEPDSSVAEPQASEPAAAEPDVSPEPADEASPVTPEPGVAEVPSADPEPGVAEVPEPSADLEPDEPAADPGPSRFDEATARSQAALQRMSAERDQHQASSDYIARIERESQAAAEAQAGAEAEQAEVG
jgi:hypothetical protein